METEEQRLGIDIARNLISVALDRPLHAIPADGSVDTVPAWDSLAHVRIILAIEQALGRALDSQTIGSLRSVSDVADALREPTA